MKSTKQNKNSYPHSQYSSTKRAKKPRSTAKPRPSETILVAFNKPMNVLCQFTGEEQDTTLAAFIDIPNIYPAGRLDKDSEGLLLLTNDGQLQARIASPKFKLPKIYYVLVEGIPSNAALQALRDGVELKDGKTQPAEVELVSEPEWLWPRTPAVRVRKTIQDTWLKVTIREGKNRQVRRMTAHIGHPTLRLIRFQVGDYAVAGLAPGEYRKIPV